MKFTEELKKEIIVVLDKVINNYPFAFKNTTNGNYIGDEIENAKRLKDKVENILVD